MHLPGRDTLRMGTLLAVLGPRLKRMVESGDNDIDGAARLNGFAALLHFLLFVFAIWAMVSKLGF